MVTVTVMSLERRVELRGEYGRDARAMFSRGRLNTHEIAQVLGVPEHAVVRQRLHLGPLPPSFSVAPDDMPPPRAPNGRAA